MKLDKAIETLFSIAAFERDRMTRGAHEELLKAIESVRNAREASQSLAHAVQLEYKGTMLGAALRRVNTTHNFEELE